MKVTYNWLKDFVDIKLAPQALADKLTMAGIEVKGIEKKEGDFVFEIEITSNRPDWLSVIGIAREVAAITGVKFRAHSVERIAYRKKLHAKRYPLNPKNLQLKIESKKDCPFYSAKVITGVKVGPSPAWLKKRLELVGCRSVNNVVDITNYILFEYGEPLHVFDLDKIVYPSTRLSVRQAKIITRRAKTGEEIITIDGAKRILNDEILVIASVVGKETGRPEDRKTDRPEDGQAGRPVAIAGIMGGKETEVIEGTKNILLEAAVFDPALIRRGRQKLKMQTGSSYRFERGVDSQTAESASLRAAQLIQDIAGGTFVLAKSCASQAAKPPVLNLNRASLLRVLGVNIPSRAVKKILLSLGFSAGNKSAGTFLVRPPLFRQDVKAEADLIEEVARIFGYENIPVTLAAARPHLSPLVKEEPVSLIKNILSAFGLNEVITYSLASREAFDCLRHDYGRLIEIDNPLSCEQEVLRPTLIPGLARSIAVNLNQKQSHIGIFEIGRLFSFKEGSLKESLFLGIALCGSATTMSGQGMIREKLSFAHLKGIICSFFSRLGIEEYSFTAGAGLVQVNFSAAQAGVLLKLKKNALDCFGIKNEEVFAAELCLDNIFAAAKTQKRFKPLPLYPGIARDISIVVKDIICADDIIKALRLNISGLLEEAKVSDYYRGKHIPRGFQGLTISCLYRASDRTLTEEEVLPLHGAAIALLSKDFAAQIR